MRKAVFARQGARRVMAAVLCAPLVLLTACGGGGGGDDTPAGGGSNASGVVITSSNSQPIAAEAVETASSTDAASGAGFFMGVQVDDRAGSAHALLLARAAQRLVAKAPTSAPLATAVATTETVPCTSGSLTLTVNTSTSGTLAAGDSFQMTANSCSEGSGDDLMVMNGAITINVLSGNYDPVSTVYPKTLGMRIVAQGFSVTAGGETEVFTGDLTLSVNETSATSASLSMKADSLTSNLGGSHTLTLSNYSMNVTEGSGGSSITMSASVQTTNSRLGSGTFSYTVATVTPLTVSSSGAITTGSIKVTGSGSSLLLTATGSDAFTLEVDTNGDGTFDSGTAVTRTELQALI
jgi:hypothetical protein